MENLLQLAQMSLPLRLEFGANGADSGIEVLFEAFGDDLVLAGQWFQFVEDAMERPTIGVRVLFLLLLFRQVFFRQRPENVFHVLSCSTIMHAYFNFLSKSTCSKFALLYTSSVSPIQPFRHSITNFTHFLVETPCVWRMKHKNCSILRDFTNKETICKAHAKSD